MNQIPESLEQNFATIQLDLERIRDALGQVIVGQSRVIDDLVTAVFAGGHVLLEGLPGLGKTHLVKALAASVDLPLARVQCTPDVMPADITGSEVLLQDEQGQHRLDFRHGPIFSPVLLVDEINRATPKTQSALLEAMQEHQVTYAGTRYPLPSPFWVFATQNPIELEGTYPLPEAQLDRFLFKVSVRYPDDDALLRMLDISLDDEPADHLGAVLDRERVETIMQQAREVMVARPLREAAVRLVKATHPDTGSDTSPIRYGASPRGLQALLRAARVRALMEGRAQVALEDLGRVARPALEHRILLTMESEMDGVQVTTVLDELVARCLHAN